MSQALVALIAALVGAGAAIGGQLLGPMVQSRRAHQTWVRDKRAELCEQYVSLFSDAEEDLFDRFSRKSSAQPSPDEQERILEELAERSWDRSVQMRLIESRLRIYGSAPLLAALSEARGAYNIAWTTELSLTATKFKTLRDDALTQISKELGITRP